MTVQDLQDKKIVFFVAETPPSMSGSGITAYHLAKHLSQFTSHIKMISFNYNQKLNRREKHGFLQIKRISYYNLNILTKLLSLPWLILKYLREIYNQDICLIYGSYMPAYEVIILYNLVCRVKTVFVSTLLKDDDIRTVLTQSLWLTRGLRKVLFSRISLYWAINKKFQKICKEQLGSRPQIFLSTQGVNHMIFHPVTEKRKLEIRISKGYSEKCLIIISVGYLIERKGYSQIFKTLAELKIPFLYIIAGSLSNDIYHKTSLKERVEMHQLYQLGNKLLGDKVLFLGSLNDIHILYSLADILIHGAVQEGTPNVILEAMACRIPIIVKRLEGLENILEHKKNALIYDKPEELKMHVEQLAENKDLQVQIANGAYQTILEHHTIEKVAINLFSHIEN